MPTQRQKKLFKQIPSLLPITEQERDMKFQFTTTLL